MNTVDIVVSVLMTSKLFKSLFFRILKRLNYIFRACFSSTCRTMQMSTVCVENLEPWELFTANRSSPDAATIGTATSSLAVDIGTLTTSREEMEFAVLVTVVGVCAVIAVVCLYSRGRVFDGVKALFAWIVLNTVNVATGQKTQFCGYSSCCFVCFIGGNA